MITVDIDPHFYTLNGHKVDYHGECDLVYTQCKDFGNGDGLNIHVRTRHVEPKKWSTLSSIAVQIGEDIFEINEDGSYYVNYEENPKLPLKIANKYELSSFVHKDSFKCNIDLLNEQSIVVGHWKNANALYFHLSLNNNLSGDFSSCQGISSTLDHPATSGANGALIGRNDKAYDVKWKHFRAFAEEWQVRPLEDPVLFRQESSHSVPQYPDECKPSPFDENTLEGRRKLDQLRKVDGGVYHRRAMEACNYLDGSHHHEACMFDVFVTGNPEWANAPWYETN